LRLGSAHCFISSYSGPLNCLYFLQLIFIFDFTIKDKEPSPNYHARVCHIYHPRCNTASVSSWTSSTKHLLDHVARHAVEEQGDEDYQQQEQDHFEDEPAVVVPEDVADRLKWVQEPDKRRVGSAALNNQSTTAIDRASAKPGRSIGLGLRKHYFRRILISPFRVSNFNLAFSSGVSCQVMFKVTKRACDFKLFAKLANISSARKYAFNRKQSTNYNRM